MTALLLTHIAKCVSLNLFEKVGHRKPEKSSTDRGILSTEPGSVGLSCWKVSVDVLLKVFI